MNLLIIGGSGFIGSFLANKLEERGFKFKIFDKKMSKAFPDKVVLGDVRDKNALTNAMKGFDVIVNLAAEHRDDITPTSLYYDVNVDGARNIISAAESNGIKKIIFTSTVAVYGLNKPSPNETSPTEPFNHYGKSKIEAEHLFNDWASDGDGKCLITLRPVVVFGEGNRGNVYNLIKQISDGKFVMVGSGTNRKSMAYVGNIVEFIVFSLGFTPGKYLFNFASKPDLTILEIVTIIRNKLGVKPMLPRIPFVFGLCIGSIFDIVALLTDKKFPVSSVRIRKFCADSTVATDALDGTGFRSPYSLNEGLTRMIANLEQEIYAEGGI